MKTVSISVDEAVWEAAQQAASRANADLNALLQEHLRQLGSGTAIPVAQAERASRKRLLDLLSECNISLDGRPTRESFYTDRRFH